MNLKVHIVDFNKTYNLRKYPEIWYKFIFLLQLLEVRHRPKKIIIVHIFAKSAFTFSATMLERHTAAKTHKAQKESLQALHCCGSEPEQTPQGIFIQVSYSDWLIRHSIKIIRFVRHLGVQNLCLRPAENPYFLQQQITSIVNNETRQQVIIFLFCRYSFNGVDQTDTSSGNKYQ